MEEHEEGIIQENIISGNLDELMGERFGRYSKYVIQERALPDARDGLKPVQRRILFAMDQLGLHNEKAYKKSARIVGEVIGKYHPHGDTSVYDAMVRLSQDWKVRVPLIDMHGNNGSIDGDGAAAMRYTETRLSKASATLLSDIDKKTVDFAPNFDDSEWEPVVLPSGFPNLLANGATGIAAGYATNIPPHNLKEIIDATIVRAKNPECTFAEVRSKIKGPDFPTGGIIEGKEGIDEALKTGRGRVVVKAKVHFETNEDRTKSLIITEVPYEVNKANLVRKIDGLRFEEKIPGIVEVRDETDRTGLRIAIDLEKGVDHENIKNALFKSTEMQTYYSYNMVAIVEGTPKQLGVIELIDAYLLHRKDIVTKRTNFLLDKNEKRLEIVNGLILAVNHLDAVIKMIRKSVNKADAKNRLMDKYKLSDDQAEAIVTLRLYRLSSTDIETLQTERENLKELIKDLKLILKKEKVLMGVIIDELKEAKEKHETPRLTKVVDEIEEIVIDEKALIKNEDCMVVITKDGYLKRIPSAKYNKEEADEKTFEKKSTDIVVSTIDTNTLEQILLIMSNGKYVLIDVHNIKQSSWTKPGTHINDYVKLGAGKHTVISCLQIKSFRNKTKITLVSKEGMIKRVDIRALQTLRNNKSMIIMKLKKGDEVVTALPNTTNKNYILVVTKNGMAAKYLKEAVSVIGTNTSGVQAMKLKKGDYIAGATLVSEKDMVLALTSRGNGKRFDSDEIPLTGRTTVGRPISKQLKTVKEDIICIHRIKPKNEIYVNVGDTSIKLFARDIPIFSLDQTFSNIKSKTFFSAAVRYHHPIDDDGSKELRPDADKEEIEELKKEDIKDQIQHLEKERDYAEADADAEKTSIINMTISELTNEID